MRYAHLVVGLVLATSVSACTSWHAARGETATVLRTRTPDQVRVTTSDGSRVRVLDPWIDGDSLAGERLSPESAGARTPQRVRIGLADITRLEIAARDVARTTLLVVVAAPIAIYAGSFVWLAVRCGTGCGN